MWKHSKEQVNDILITACEGGVNYWAIVKDYDPDKGTATLLEIDSEGHDPYTLEGRVPRAIVKKHSLTPAVIRKGLKLAAESEQEHIRFIAFRDILDAEDADIVIQLGLLGEIVYG